MKTNNPNISINVIIPIAPHEHINENFINALKYLHLKLPETSKIILAIATEKTTASSSTSTSSSTSSVKVLETVTEPKIAATTTKSIDAIKRKLSQYNIRDLHLELIEAESGRANCMNTGTKVIQTKDSYLFFVHADTIFEENSYQMLENVINKYPDSLMYFDLHFYDGHPLMRLNELGVWFRTRFLKTPFGDQCFCIREDIFESLGGYPSDVCCGEDHMFVRKARRNKVKIIPVKAKVKTSARKYINNGWLKTTLLHLLLWRKQIHKDRKMVSGGDIG